MSDREEFERAVSGKVDFRSVHFHNGRYVANEPYIYGSDSKAAKLNLMFDGWQAARSQDGEAVTPEAIKNRLICATRQYRHNSDNSPDVFNPKQGFAFGYDREEVDALISDLVKQK